MFAHFYLLKIIGLWQKNIFKKNKIDYALA
jgi:hypothetical protein